MRTVEESTQPIPAPVTAQHRRWPTTNELVDLAPIPEVGDYIGPISEPIPTAYLAPPTMETASAMGPFIAPQRSSGMSTAALVLALMSVPLLLLFGLGAIPGFAAIGLGIAGVRQVSRNPQAYRGSGRAVTGIIVGTGSVIIGAPFLLLTMGLLALL